MSGTRKQEQSQGTVWLNGMLRVLKGGAWGVGVCLAILGVAACLIWLGLLSNGAAGRAVVAACLLGGFAGGLIGVGKGAAAPLSQGRGAGTVLFLLLLTAGVLIYDALPGVQTVGVVAGACLCGGGLAGVLGRGGGKKRRKR